MHGRVSIGPAIDTLEPARVNLERAVITRNGRLSTVAADLGSVARRSTPAPLEE